MWRSIFKALVLLDYLIKNGSDEVVIVARQRKNVVDGLKEFKVADRHGVDRYVPYKFLCLGRMKLLLWYEEE